MGTCTKSALLGEVDELAIAHAQANGSISLEVARDTARSVVEQAFGSLVLDIASASLEHWPHWGTADHEANWRNLLISRDSLIDAAERYLETPWMWCRNLDWLFANSLVYAEFLAYLDSVKTKRYGSFRAAAEKDGDKTVLRWLRAGRVAMFLIKWLAWLAVVALALAIHPVAAALVAAATITWKALGFYEWQRQNKLLQAMIQAYTPLRSPTLSWRIVWDELNVARKRGVVWDGAVYRLVELRMAGHGSSRSFAPAD